MVVSYLLPPTLTRTIPVPQVGLMVFCLDFVYEQLVHVQTACAQKQKAW